MTGLNRLLFLGLALAVAGGGVAAWMATRSAATSAAVTPGGNGENGDPPADRAEQWKKVDAAMKQGLPQTAIKELDPIIESAMKDKAYPEAIKAIGRKLVLVGNIQGNKPEEKITRMAAVIANAPAEMKPVLHAIQAHWYWQFFQQNRWRFVQRTNVDSPASDDILTWTLPRILAEIDTHFAAALAAEKELKATPIESYAELLEKGTIPDKYRPTLFDFLAFDAIGFYATGEQGGAKAQDTFVMAADSPVFAPVAEFLRWKPETTDDTSRTVKAIRLYQNLLNFHQNDADKAAFLDTDLHRLRFGYNQAVGDKDRRYVSALRSFDVANEAHELRAMARYQWAGVLQKQGKLVDARSVALIGQTAFPDSPGGKLCYNLVQGIEAKSAAVSTDRVWADPQTTVRVHYKNITKAYFRLVKADYVERLKASPWRPEGLNEQQQTAMLREKPAVSFSHDLPATPDYQERTEAIAIPKAVPPGFYYLLSSHDPDFGPGGNVVSYTDVWVADLAIVTRQDYGSPQIDGLVTTATTGTPVEGAQVQVWVRRQQGNGWDLGGTVTTDKAGRYSSAGQNQRGHLVVVTHNGQQLASAHDQYVYRQNNVVQAHEQTVFFTDRSLYRPGQTIQFKGICIRYHQGNDNYEVVPNRSVSVVFRDPNGKEVSRTQVQTNDYGSFSGTVIAPRDRVTGRMSLHAEGGPNGGAAFNVEEYKRPKFLVTVEVPKEPGKLNETVNVPGKAVSYNGVPIGGAAVRFRVVREVRYPPWFFEYCWWRPMPRTPAQEIAHGTATTGPNGEFTIPFVAKPDLTVPEKDEPSFRYTVTVDVTDTTGETRSGSKAVEVGYVALRATVSVPEWNTADANTKLTVTTATLDGEPQTAKGTLKVYRLKQPATVARPELDSGYRPWQPVLLAADAEPKPDPAKPVSWELGEVAFDTDFTTDAKGTATLTAKLPAGVFRAVVTTKDKFGKAVTAKAQVPVLNPTADRLNITVPNIVSAPKWTLEPGEEFTLFWGTGYESGRAFIEVEHRGKLLHAAWTDPAKTQATVKVPVTEAMRGGFHVRVSYVRENRAYLTSRHVNVPWTNKQLTVKWEHFVSKLEPGKKETFTAVITGPDAKRAVAEMVAGMYDASLDAFLPHQWQAAFGVFRQDHSRVNLQFENLAKQLNHLQGQWPHSHKSVDLTYRGFPAELTQNYQRYEYFGKGGGGGWEAQQFLQGHMRGGFGGGAMAPGMAPEAAMADGAANTVLAGELGSDKADGKNAAEGGEPGSPGPDLSQVAARTNLNETAFFFPHLIADAEGVVRMEFTMPEALTKWKFMGFAHDKELRAGLLTDEVVTAKDLMAQPNPPRFLREGDQVEFTAKISNRWTNAQRGLATLTFKDALTDKSVDAALGLADAEQAFDIGAGDSQTLSWKVRVPDGVGPLTYRVVAASRNYSDGEEGIIPVISRRVLVSESIAMPIRNPGTKTFELTKLKESGKSDTIKSQSYTVQAVSQPAWYAVQALPYLMEYPHECSEQTFNRLYANALARHIAAADPKIRKIFDLWKGTAALDSALEKNPDLKAVLLDETPWVRQAVAETQARKNVGILFDANRLNQETAALTRKLAELQHADGAWPWFPGGPGNDYITLYITTGYGRLRHLGVQVDTATAVKAVGRLDNWMKEQHDRILKLGKPDENHLSPTVAPYLYARSFFVKDRPVDDAHKAAFDYWQGQAKKYWLQLANRQSQGHIVLALKRLGDADTATGIMKSIKERSVSTEEMGMFWRDTELNFSWYRAPIETQALMVEAFDEVMNDAAAVEDCKVWLLKQKQTRDWKTTKATADAVYALLLRGSNLLKSEALVEATVGGQKIVPEKVEAGTGFYEERFVKGEVTPNMGTVTLTKTDPGVSWASAHWQYLEDISKVTPHTDNPLTVGKKLYKRTFTKAGPVLTEVKPGEPLAVGDEVVTRVTIRTDRDMEYVHLKDHRGSGTEPVNVLSRYRYQDGLGYYESTKDTASHFFIDYLPKGTYVFEYAVRVQLKGQYSTGFASLQCMYAPEFNSHSESIPLEVK